jgi:hypothetical protein
MGTKLDDTDKVVDSITAEALRNAFQGYFPPTGDITIGHINQAGQLALLLTCGRCIEFKDDIDEQYSIEWVEYDAETNTGGYWTSQDSWRPVPLNQPEESLL